MPPETPERLGPYQVLAPLGRRGSLLLYEGVEAAGNRPVTLKVLQPRLAENAEASRRFAEAVERAAGLAPHAHVVQIVGRGQQDGVPFAAFERFSGGPLHDVLRQRRLSLQEAMEVFKSVCRALQHAHGRGVLHGDLNPWTVLVTPDLSEVKVTDFGLGRLQPSGTLTTTINTTEITLGGFHYLAPELLAPDAQADPRADLYSAGVMFHEMLTGRAPAGKFSLPSQLNGELPPEIDPVVLKSLARRPEDRYASAGELLAELERLEETLRLRLLSELRGITRGTKNLLGGGEEAGAGGGKRTLLLVVAIAVLLALLAAAGLLFSCRPQPRAEPAPAETPETSERWQAVWEDARRRGVDFRGLGQEPGWYVEVKEGEEVLLVADYGERRVMTGPPTREAGGGGRVTYRARADGQALAVLVEPVPCSDAMSGIPFPATVTVTLDGREYRGCGRFLR